MEGQRFFDLRRWGLAYAAAAINGYIAVEKTRVTYKASADAFASKHLLFPIPYLQVELSKTGTTDNLKQNPGW